MIGEKERHALIILFSRYKSIIVSLPETQTHKDGYPVKCSNKHLLSLCEEALGGLDRYPSDKLHRWLGFIQGVLAVTGILDVDEERVFSRPLLHAMHDHLIPTFGS